MSETTPPPRPKPAPPKTHIPLKVDTPNKPSPKQAPVKRPFVPKPHLTDRPFKDIKKNLGE